MNSVELIRPQLERLQRMALPVGVVGLLLTVAGYILGPKSFFHSYLIAYMFVLGLTLGSMAWLLIHQVAGGGAFFLVRRLFEASTRCLPFVMVAFIPILLDLSGLLRPSTLYEWAHADIVAHDAVLQKKVAYLNVPFFIGRAIFYFAVWGFIANRLNVWGRQQSEGDARATHKLSMWGALFLILYVFTMTFAAFDWVMSLTPHWYSSLYGVIFIIGQGLSTLCLMHILITYLTNGTKLREWVPQNYFRDLGNLTLAFTMLWAYTNYSQWVIIWSGNIAEEVDWYAPRVQTAWVYVGAALIACHFVLPFLTLLSSSVKVRIDNLAKLAVLILLMRLLDLRYYITPTFSPGPHHPRPDQIGEGISAYFTNLADIGAVLGLCGIWLWLWSREMLKSRSLVPDNDPRFAGKFVVPESPVVPVGEGVASHG